MYLKNLRLHNFRLLSQVELEFSPNINLICGDNAQGKSSLLEAIYLLSTGQSFRGSSFKEMVKKKESGFFLEGFFEREGIEESIRITFDGKEKKYYYDGEYHSSFSKLLPLFPLTLYSPEDIELVSGPPSCRRRAMNILLAKADSSYLFHLFRYARALRHRNILLKEKKERGIEVFEEELAKSGSYLTVNRYRFCQTMQPILQAYYQEIVQGEETPSLSYRKPSYFDEEEKVIFEKLLQALSHHRKKEKEMGHSLIGPHRDDLSFAIDEMPAKIYASEGQKRSLACAFRMGQREYLEAKQGRDSAFAIDDFGSHLDENRKMGIEKLLPAMGQVFLTTPSHSSLSSVEARSFQLEKGKIYNLSNVST